MLLKCVLMFSLKSFFSPIIKQLFLCLTKDLFFIKVIERQLIINIRNVLVVMVVVVGESVKYSFGSPFV